MGKKWKFGLLIAGLLISITVFGLMVSVKEPEPAFVQQRHPVFHRRDLPSSRGPVLETRTFYSWQEPVEAVAMRAGEELTRKGYVGTITSEPGWMSWSWSREGSDRSFKLIRGIRTSQEPARGAQPGDLKQVGEEGWLTIEVTTDLPQNAAEALAIWCDRHLGSHLYRRGAKP